MCLFVSGTTQCLVLCFFVVVACTRSNSAQRSHLRWNGASRCKKEQQQQQFEISFWTDWVRHQSCTCFFAIFIFPVSKSSNLVSLVSDLIRWEFECMRLGNITRKGNRIVFVSLGLFNFFSMLLLLLFLYKLRLNMDMKWLTMTEKFPNSKSH